MKEVDNINKNSTFNYEFKWSILLFTTQCIEQYCNSWAFLFSPLGGLFAVTSQTSNQ